MITKQAKFLVLFTVACIGLFGDVAIGGFCGVCVLLFFAFVGDAKPAERTGGKYEREEPTQQQPPKKIPYNPNDY
jgi:MFS superfamily sulfate permease-like transporter